MGSVSKAFLAASIMKMVQDGHLRLNDSAFQVLGYFNSNGEGRALRDYDPVNGAAVRARVAPTLAFVTIQSLLNMSSGLPETVPVESSTFPPPAGKKHLVQPVIYVAGSYAALGFAGAIRKLPYRGAPASVEQQIDDYVYSFSKNGFHLVKPGSYAYSDTGYAVLGAVAQRLAQKFYHMNYAQFLQTYILGPMGIAPPLSNPPADTAMAGVGKTLKENRYPTEVQYFANGKQPPAPSIFPNHHATKLPSRRAKQSPSRTAASSICRRISARGPGRHTARAGQVLSQPLRGLRRRDDRPAPALDGARDGRRGHRHSGRPATMFPPSTTPQIPPVPTRRRAGGGSGGKSLRAQALPTARAPGRRMAACRGRWP